VDAKARHEYAVSKPFLVSVKLMIFNNVRYSGLLFQIFFDFLEKCGIMAFRGMKESLFVTEQTDASTIDN